MSFSQPITGTERSLVSLPLEVLSNVCIRFDMETLTALRLTCKALAPAAESFIFKKIHLEPNWDSVLRLTNIANHESLRENVQHLRVDATLYSNLNRTEWDKLVESYEVGSQQRDSTPARFREYAQNLGYEQIEAAYQTFRKAIKVQNMLLLGLSPQKLYRRLVLALSGLANLDTITIEGGYRSKYAELRLGIYHHETTELRRSQKETLTTPSEESSGNALVARFVGTVLLAAVNGNPSLKVVEVADVLSTALDYLVEPRSNGIESSLPEALSLTELWTSLIVPEQQHPDSEGLVLARTTSNSWIALITASPQLGVLEFIPCLNGNFRLTDVDARTFTTAKLWSLTITSCYLADHELRALLLGIRDTLKELYFESSYLQDGHWADIFELCRHDMDLEMFELQQGLYTAHGIWHIPKHLEVINVNHDTWSIYQDPSDAEELYFRLSSYVVKRHDKSQLLTSSDPDAARQWMGAGIRGGIKDMTYYSWKQWCKARNANKRAIARAGGQMIGSIGPGTYINDAHDLGARMDEKIVEQLLKEHASR